MSRASLVNENDALGGPRADLSSASCEPKDVYIQVPPDFRDDAGDLLPDTHIRLRRHGRRNGAPILIMGAAAHDRRISGAAGWWRDIVAQGGAIDLDRYCALGLDFTPTGDDHVVLSPKTQARLIAHALDRMGIDRLPYLIGACYGGAVALTFAALQPSRVDRLCIIQAAHQPGAMAMAWRGAQRRIVEFALAQKKGGDGVALARQIDLIARSTGEAFGARFNCLVGHDGRSDLDRHLMDHAHEVAALMSPRRFLSLSAAADRTWVAPELIKARTMIVACRTDQLVPLSDIQDLVARLPKLASLHMLASNHGHDAFLREPEQLGSILAAFLASAADD